MKPLLDYIPILSRRVRAALRSFNAAAKAGTGIGGRLSGAAAVLTADKDDILKHMVVVPYKYLVQLFDFKNPAYMTVSNGQSTVKNYLGLNVYRSDTGPIRALYSDPGRLLNPPNMGTIFEDPIENNIRCSAALLAAQDKIHETHRELMIVIRDEFNRESDLFKVAVFAMRGVALPGGQFQFDQIFMPSYDPATGKLGPNTQVNVNDHDAVSRALAFAVKCKNAIMGKQELRIGAFLHDVYKIPYSSRALPGVDQLPSGPSFPAATLK